MKILPNKSVLRYRYLLEIWKLAKVQRWAARHPIISRWYKMDLETSIEENEATIIPIREIIQEGKNMVLPFDVLEPLILNADGHMVLERCPCRNGEGCQMYPHDFGCLFLGKSVREVSPKIGKQTDIKGALTHINKALEMGLVPMIVHASFDAALISIPFDRMLAVCFCCDCCCTIRLHMRLGPSTFDDTVKRLPGLRVEIEENCGACGICHTKCPVNAIQFKAGKSVIDQALCKGCGMCSVVCPVGAPKLILDRSVDIIEKLTARIRERTEIGL